MLAMATLGNIDWRSCQLELSERSTKPTEGHWQYFNLLYGKTFVIQSFLFGRDFVTWHFGELRPLVSSCSAGARQTQRTVNGKMRKPYSRNNNETRKFSSLQFYFLLHYLQTIFLHCSTLQKRDIRKINYTSSKKQNARAQWPKEEWVSET